VSKIQRNRLLTLTGFNLSVLIGFFLISSLVATVSLQPDASQAAVSVNINATVTQVAAVCGDNTATGSEECDGTDFSACESEQCYPPGHVAECTCVVAVCFLPDTAITMADGTTKPIQDITAGDVVLSYDEKSDQLTSSAVAETFVHQASQYLTINNRIKVTPNHPLFINDQWVEAGQARAGDSLVHSDGSREVIQTIELIKEKTPVYNFEVADTHTYFAESILAHNKGPVCTPVTACGTCNPVTLKQTCTLSNGCTPPTTYEQDCVLTLEILNVSHTNITETSARINWATNLASDSLVEWAVSTGGACAYDSSFYVPGAVTNHGIDLTGLTPSTQYCYRVTSATASLTAVRAGFVFTTLGPSQQEICDNGIDDDNDGLIDIEDPDCPCTPQWQCTPEDWDEVQCINGIQTRSCEKIPVNGLICWNNEPGPEGTRSCSEQCPDLTCPPLHTIDEATCSCVPIPGACGNLVCEVGELCTCPSDCSGQCIPNWQCEPPTFEQAQCLNGIKQLVCTDYNECGTAECKPPTIQSCVPGCDVICQEWQRIDAQTCSCINIVPYCPNLVCEDGETFENCPEDCREICYPSWIPGDWGACIDGIQYREYTDANNCPIVLQPPPNQRCCLEGCDIACGLCEQLDLDIQACVPVIPCCGDRICQVPNENTNVCPSDCAIPPSIVIPLPACLDGLDNDNDGLVDYPVDPGCASPVDDSELNFGEIIERIFDSLDNPAVEQANEAIAAPTIIAIATVNTFAAFSFFNLASYLRFLLTQPFAIIARRKRKKWGVVYNAVTKEPIDLAIVRLYQQENSRLVQSRVTDRNGRYSFIVAAVGRYYMTVTKPKFTFPSETLKDRKEDGKYLDLYHGEIITISENKAVITANIPLDPADDTRPPRKVIFQYYLRKTQYALAFSAVPIAAVSMIISPGPLTFTLFGFHVLLFILFRRLGYQKPPKSWGIIYDKKTGKPLSLAIARIYDKQYNKLLETRVTDAKGRYAFLVDNNVYYLTADKKGYQTSRSQDIDLVEKKREAVVNENIGLQPGEALPSSAAPAAPSESQPSQQPVSTQPVKSADQLVDRVSQLEQSVGRKSLEELMQAKESADKLKKDIDTQQATLEQLEDKVEHIETELEQKIKPPLVAEPPTPVTSVTPPPAEPPLEKPAVEPKSEPKKSAPPTAPKPPKSIFG